MISAATPVALRVGQFFQQLENNGRLQSLAGNPLLLHGLLSVAVRAKSSCRTPDFSCFRN